MIPVLYYPQPACQYVSSDSAFWLMSARSKQLEQAPSILNERMYLDSFWQWATLQMPREQARREYARQVAVLWNARAA
jgi:hypothetical protein